MGLLKYLLARLSLRKNAITRACKDFGGTQYKKYTVERVLSQAPLSYISEHYTSTPNRLRIMAHLGCACVACGTKGVLLRSDRHKNDVTSGFHKNVYGYFPNGVMVMITADHIVPKSKGGGNSLDNLQPMCERCNSIKSDNMEDPYKYERALLRLKYLPISLWHEYKHLIKTRFSAGVAVGMVFGYLLRI